jgi:inorganic pyrophosphatase
MGATALLDLPAFDKATGDLNAIIETPQGSANKIKLDADVGLFRLGHVLPAGSSFPYDFGFVPSTRGEDGDPLDVLVLMDCPTFAGCLVPSRPVAVIEAEQSEGGRKERNDRLIAVAAASRRHESVNGPGDLGEELLQEIQEFFVSYNRVCGREFKPLGVFGADRAKALVEKAQSVKGGS